MNQNKTLGRPNVWGGSVASDRTSPEAEAAELGERVAELHLL